MLGYIKKFFSCQSMIKKEQIVGEIPASKEIYQRMFRVAWPSAIETVLVGLIGSVDTIMVGSIGAAAIAAVGITNQPKFILLCLIMSLNVGVTAIVARRKGEGNKLSANRCLRQSLMISAAFSLILAIIGYVWAKPFMHFSGAQEDYIDTAVQYFRIIVIGIFPTGISLTINAAQRGVGNTRISMKTNLVANIVNLILNFFLITGKFGFPRLEVTGAAIATVIGNFVGCFLSVKSVFHSDGFLHVQIKSRWTFDKKTIFGLFNVGGSAFVEQICLRVGFLAFAKIVASLGTIAFATHQICLNILNISFSFGDGLSIAASAMVGQCLGAKRPDLSIIYGKTAQRMALFVSCFIFALFTLAGKYLVMLFSTEPEIVTLGANILIIAAIVTHGQTSQVVMSGCLRGAGDTIFVAGSSLVSTAIIRPTLTYVLCYPFDFGLYGAWLALAIDQYMRLLINFLRFSSGKWTKIKL